jgi:uncharacterized protein YuzE
MRVTFDGSGDSAYIYLVPIAPGESVEQRMVEGPHGTIVLDFDREGRLLGIEVFENATKAFRLELLESAEKIG